MVEMAFVVSEKLMLSMTRVASLQTPKSPKSRKYEKIQNPPPRVGHRKKELEGLFFWYFWAPPRGGGFFFRIFGIQGFLGSVPGPQARNTWVDMKLAQETQQEINKIPTRSTICPKATNMHLLSFHRHSCNQSSLIFHRTTASPSPGPVMPLNPQDHCCYRIDSR